MSVVVHEVSHGFSAYLLGDPTASLEGRLTLNPLKHLDPIGSVVVPILTLSLGFVFGWAKPVPFNPYNLKNRRTGELIIALAGPLSNIILAILFTIILRIMSEFSLLNAGFVYISVLIIFVNITLAIFNLIPVPPLDGSKILFSLLPPHLHAIRDNMERYALPLAIFVLFVVWKVVSPIVPWLSYKFIYFAQIQSFI